MESIESREPGRNLAGHETELAQAAGLYQKTPIQSGPTRNSPSAAQSNGAVDFNAPLKYLCPQRRKVLIWRRGPNPAAVLFV